MDSDDFSIGDDSVSVYSASHSKIGGGGGSITSSSKRSVPKITPVSKLRPRKPVTLSQDESISSVCAVLSSKRSDAALLVDANGSLSGICTDVDFTRRVVAKDMDPVYTSIDKVFTANPKCVMSSDSALDALTLMMDHHFRHLPVIDGDGSISGVLDIAKLINDLISRLEKSVEKAKTSASTNSGGGDANNAMVAAAAQAIMSNSGSRGGGNQAAALQALLALMNNNNANDSNAGSNSGGSQTLRSLLKRKPSTIVSPETAVYDAAIQMAESRKASLIVNAESRQLVGIFGFKDMLTRVLGKQKDPHSLCIKEVMTKDPMSVSPDMTVLEALQCMHDNRFLTLPVCEEISGEVVGVVDVMDVIYGCGNAEFWRGIFESAMDSDDFSIGDDSVSVYSASHSKIGGGGGSITSSSKRSSPKITPVSKLRPRKPVTLSQDESISSVCAVLSSKRSDAALLVDANGSLSGICTDVDFTRRVVAKDMDPVHTSIDKVFTANPKCVMSSDSALDALTLMMDHHFRHLPVIDGDGSISGVLDIAKLINDLISRLEKSVEKAKTSASTNSGGGDANNAMVAAAAQAIMSNSGSGGGGNQAAALQALLALMNNNNANDSNAGSNSGGSQTLRSLLKRKPSTIVSPETAVYDAAIQMAESRKASLIVNAESRQLVGIFGFKDMLTRVLGKQKNPHSLCIKEVMTKDPMSVSPDMTVLEALQCMHDNRFLTLPVCEEISGEVVGVVDVMDVIYGCGNAEFWRGIFESAMDSDDFSIGDDSKSVSKSTRRLVPTSTPAVVKPAKIITETPRVFVEKHPGSNIPFSIDIGDSIDNQNDPVSTLKGFNDAVSMLDDSLPPSNNFNFVFKVVDKSTGNYFRIRSENSMDKLLSLVAMKLGDDVLARSIKLSFIDDEGDSCILKDDDCLTEAIHVARSDGKEALKIFAEVDSALVKKLNLPDNIEKKETKGDQDNTMVIAAAVAGIVAVGAIFLFTSRKK